MKPYETFGESKPYTFFFLLPQLELYSPCLDLFIATVQFSNKKQIYTTTVQRVP